MKRKELSKGRERASERGEEKEKKKRVKQNSKRREARHFVSFSSILFLELLFSISEALLQVSTP